jgi:alkyl sulfatase BDS1-like metallo-beta-lactamase superfamily hydrolase
MQGPLGASALFVSLLIGSAHVLAAGDREHYHPKGKLPSKYTVEAQRALREQLPLDDVQDFEEQKRGFIAAPPYRQIMAEAGHVAWDMGRYEFLLEGEDFDSIHPSLQRQAILNMNYGLYEVIPGIYQVRGFDLANISFIKGETGWIVFDPLTAKETAKAALEFVNEKLGERPVKAVVYSHSHADHFGGVRGVVDEADVRAGKVKIIAPVGFMANAVAENVYAGNAMNRRLFFQYGVLLPASPFGHVDQSIGKNVAAGNLGLIEPTVIIRDPFEELTIDGVKMIFQNTPDTEAPAEMNTYFPELKAFWAAENITGTIHNIYTLRGALVRDALEWSKQINVALYRFGREAEVMFASHSWPRWGNGRIQEVMRGQRDMYGHLNNQVLHLANQGVTINEIHNVYEVPKSLQREWYARGYHGSFEHNSRAVINRYLGYWDGNPSTLTPLSPKDSAPLYVEMMGGAKKILARGRELYDEGKYRHAQEILNKLVYAEPQNQAAKDLLADTFEQLGYQYESPSVRNSFLAAALELRSGIPQRRTGRGQGHDDGAFPGLPRDPRRQSQGRGDGVQDQPRDPRQRGRVRRRDEQRHPHEHRGGPGRGRRPDRHDRPVRPGGDHDGEGDLRRSDRGREGQARGQPGGLRAAEVHARSVLALLRAASGHEAGRDSRPDAGPLRAGGSTAEGRVEDEASRVLSAVRERDGRGRLVDFLTTYRCKGGHEEAGTIGLSTSSGGGK